MNGSALYNETQSFSPWLVAIVLGVVALLAALLTVRLTTTVTPESWVTATPGVPRVATVTGSSAVLSRLVVEPSAAVAVIGATSALTVTP